MFRSASSSTAALALLLVLGASLRASAETDTQTSGALNATAADRFDCTATNRTDGDVDVTLTIKSTPAGAALLGPTLQTAPAGESVSISLRPPYPGATAYCEAEVPAGADVVSNFAVSKGPNLSSARANSALEGPPEELQVVQLSQSIVQSSFDRRLRCTSDRDFLVDIILLEDVAGDVRLQITKPSGDVLPFLTGDLPPSFTIGGAANAAFTLTPQTDAVFVVFTFRTRPGAIGGCENEFVD